MTRVEKGGFVQLGVQDKTGSVIVEKLKEDTDESTLGLEGRDIESSTWTFLLE